MNREEKNELSKEKIINACIKEFGTNEYVAASLNNICKNNNISKGLLFHYYKNKEELFLLCAERCFQDLSKYLEENFQWRGKGINEELNSYLNKRFEFFKEYSYYNQIFISAVFNPPEGLEEDIKAIKKVLDDTNKKFLSKILEDSHLKDNIDKNTALNMILDFGSYLQLKFKSLYKERKDQCADLIAEQDKAFKDMLNIFLYGIIK
jgi:AcrR family transcriptional regulator